MPRTETEQKTTPRGTRSLVSYRKVGTRCSQKKKEPKWKDDEENDFPRLQVQQCGLSRENPPAQVFWGRDGGPGEVFGGFVWCSIPGRCSRSCPPTPSCAQSGLSPQKAMGSKGTRWGCLGGSRHPPPQQNGGDRSSAAAGGAEDGKMLGKD